VADFHTKMKFLQVWSVSVACLVKGKYCWGWSFVYILFVMLQSPVFIVAFLCKLWNNYICLNTLFLLISHSL
jgi:hypothetical protein